MTNQEAIEQLKELKLHCEDFRDGEDSVWAKDIEALDMAIEALEKQATSEWIPCSERLPKVEDLHEISIEDCMCYLIQRRCGVMDVAHYIKVYGEPYFDAHCIKLNDVIAWQPLPEPMRLER